VIKPAADLRELLADGPGDGKPWTAVVWGEPAGTAALAIAPGRIPLGDVLLVIGPPQGFSERDRAALEAVARALPVSLAGRRLRSETAAVTALAWAALLDDHSVKSAGDCSSRG
jgi:16S rRNA U1498 N3-methylase RsmE